MFSPLPLTLVSFAPPRCVSHTRVFNLEKRSKKLPKKNVLPKVVILMKLKKQGCLSHLCHLLVLVVSLSHECSILKKGPTKLSKIYILKCIDCNKTQQTRPVCALCYLSHLYHLLALIHQCAKALMC